MELLDLPKNKDITYLGVATYRDKNQLFGIKRRDRRQHVYILGKSGTGKSALMFNMIIQNIQNGDGVCMVDPHGENVEAVLSAIPPHRIKDVVYFNPADTEYHIGFNVLELIDSKYKHLVASGLMGIFTKIWANAWSARMEYILNNAILALLDTPGSTLLGIPRLLVDKDYRQKIINNLKDPVIKAFWVHEYEAWQDKFRNEAIAPIQNKVGQFLSTSIIRNIVGQSKSTVDIFDLMNQGKIFLVNVSKGRIGEDNSALLGGMIITKIQLAAMERVRIPEDERKDFYLYVDEFQNFVTQAFAGILSEARKYRLNLTVAHQYTAQLVADKNSSVRDAIFGNVGTMIIFRVGADDAKFLEKEFEPEFTPQDIVNLPNFKIYLKLMIDGVSSRPFSARTMPALVKSGNKEVEEEVIRSSRRLYCRSREDVESEINNWSEMSLGESDGQGATGEKFEIECSICKKQTTVPFKPTPGRPVYCKDCMEKIKAGTLQPIKGSIKEYKRDESKFYKPLSDLGIEFAPTEQKEKTEDNPRLEKQSIFSKIKRAMTGEGRRDRERPARREERADNISLREILNKTLREGETDGTLIPVKSETPQAISLNELKKSEEPEPTRQDLAEEKPEDKAVPEEVKVPEKIIVKPMKDRAATSEAMDALKDLIDKTEIKVEEDVESKVEKGEEKAENKQEERENKNDSESGPVVPKKPKEVPEEVLRKVLEN